MDPHTGVLWPTQWCGLDGYWRGNTGTVNLLCIQWKWVSSHPCSQPPTPLLEAILISFMYILPKTGSALTNICNVDICTHILSFPSLIWKQIMHLVLYLFFVLPNNVSWTYYYYKICIIKYPFPHQDKLSYCILFNSCTAFTSMQVPEFASHGYRTSGGFHSATVTSNALINNCVYVCACIHESTFVGQIPGNKIGMCTFNFER